MIIKYMPGVSPGILLRDNWRKNARSWNISILLQATVASSTASKQRYFQTGSMIPTIFKGLELNWQPLRSWNSNLNRTKLITGKWQRQNTSSAGIGLAFFLVIEDTQFETLAAWNPNAVLANKIIICYLLFSVFPESLWAVLEGIWINSETVNIAGIHPKRVRHFGWLTGNLSTLQIL